MLEGFFAFFQNLSHTWPLDLERAWVLRTGITLEYVIMHLMQATMPKDASLVEELLLDMFLSQIL